MATCLEICTEALEWRGVLAAGREPASRMLAGAMRDLRGLYQDFAGSGALGPLQSVPIEAVYTARPGDRVINIGETPYEVTLPETVESWGEYAAIAPNDRSVVVVVGESPATYLYNAATAVWAQVETLAPESVAPMSGSQRTGLAAELCTRLKYPGLPIDANAALQARNFRVALTHHYTEAETTPEPYRPFCDYLPDYP